MAERRGRSWLFGRISPVEIQAVFEADELSAAPPTRRAGPHLGTLTSGPIGSRRTTRLPAPEPVRRIVPPDLEASATGQMLYGARAIVPWPYADLSLFADRDAANVGPIVDYQVPDTRTAARVLAVLEVSGAPGALVVHWCVIRADRERIMRRFVAAWTYESAEPITLQRGDIARLHIVTAGTAGVTVYGALSVEERT